MRGQSTTKQHKQAHPRNVGKKQKLQNSKLGVIPYREEIKGALSDTQARSPVQNCVSKSDLCLKCLLTSNQSSKCFLLKELWFILAHSKREKDLRTTCKSHTLLLVNTLYTMDS